MKYILFSNTGTKTSQRTFIPFLMSIIWATSLDNSRIIPFVIGRWLFTVAINFLPLIITSTLVSCCNAGWATFKPNELYMSSLIPRSVGCSYKQYPCWSYCWCTTEETRHYYNILLWVYIIILISVWIFFFFFEGGGSFKINFLIIIVDII